LIANPLCLLSAQCDRQTVPPSGPQRCVLAAMRRFNLT
jgi:hypothetical protein